MANEKFVNRPRVFLLGGYRISEAADEVSSQIKRASVDGAGFEDPGALTFKGPYEHEGSLAGAGTQAERELLRRLAEDPATYFCDLLESDPEASPVSDPGDAALFYACHVSDPGLPRQKGTLNRFTVSLKGGGGYPYAGVVHHTNAGDTPLGSGSTSTTPQQLGTVPAGYVLAILVCVVDPPGLTGTTPTVDADIESDNDVGFASPTTRASITQVLPAGTPSAELLVLDGDTSPITDDWWRVTFDIGGTSPGATVLVAAARRAKT